MIIISIGLLIECLRGMKFAFLRYGFLRQIDFFSISESVFESFITKNENLWIYGLGKLERFISKYYEPYLYNLKGYIVSDKKMQNLI